MEELNIGVPRNLEFRYGEKVKLDKTDKEILTLLSKDGRASVAEISRKLRISRDIIKYRIERLVKLEVIQGFVAVANPTKLGLPNMVFVNISFLSVNPKREKMLIEYLKSEPYIIYAAKTLGRWDLNIEIYSKHNKHLDVILNGIREKFSDIIKEMEITPVIEEYKWTEFPREF
jgi:Lrp/AsnC family leucine-responsive transcriptional regulator